MPNGSSSAAQRRTISRAKAGLDERLTMNTFAEARKQRRQCFDVHKRCSEVHDASSEVPHKVNMSKVSSLPPLLFRRERLALQ